MAEPTREEKLDKLEEELKKYLKVERLRLNIERTFLKSVLAKSLGNAKSHDKTILKTAAIKNVKELLGAITPEADES
jgi:hypothetical protein